MRLLPRKKVGEHKAAGAFIFAMLERAHQARGQIFMTATEENWPEELAPEAAARQYVDDNLNKYRLNPGVDYWEGWNEFVPVTEARWHWYAAFEAARACDRSGACSTLRA